MFIYVSFKLKQVLRGEHWANCHIERTDGRTDGRTKKYVEEGFISKSSIFDCILSGSWAVVLHGVGKARNRRIPSSLWGRCGRGSQVCWPALRYAVRLSGMLSGSQISLSVSRVCCQAHRFVVWLLGKFSGSQVCCQTDRCVVKLSGMLSGSQVCCQVLRYAVRFLGMLSGPQGSCQAFK